MQNKFARLLDRLDKLKKPTEPNQVAALQKALDNLAKMRTNDAAQLIRFHEILLFIRAYPQSSELLRVSESLLSGFALRVQEFVEAGGDEWKLQATDVSGIAGTNLTGVFTYDIARFLARNHASRVSIDWTDYDHKDQFSVAMRRFIPLLEEDSYVETYYSPKEWLRAAMGESRNELVWIIERFESLDLPHRDKAQLYDSLGLWIIWEYGDNSRSALRCGRGKYFIHDRPLIGRNDVSLKSFTNEADLKVEQVEPASAQKLLDLGRAAMTSRYRELHGFTFGDSGQMLRCDAGRGTDIYMWGVRPENRLPILAYHSFFIVKNRVPVGYAEALSICERAEVGLNLFYTYREGESAWTYAQLLKLLRQVAGVTVISVDPYQLGYHNDEGLRAGAFWFYRKLGFRPVISEIRKLTENEENRIVSESGYRTSLLRLKKLASSHVVFDGNSDTPRDWDGFHVRNIGLAVQKRMADEFDGNATKMRRDLTALVSRELRLKTSNWSQREVNALVNLSLVLPLISDIPGWSDREKSELVRLIRAKAGESELEFLKRSQRFAPFRKALINLGSAPQTGQ